MSRFQLVFKLAEVIPIGLVMTAVLGLTLSAQTPEEGAGEKPKVEEPQAERRRPHDLMVGDPAPVLHADEWLVGEAAKLEAGKVSLVFFWTTWSMPSLTGFAQMTELQNKYAEKGLVVIGVTSEDERGTRLFSVKKVLEEYASAIDFRMGWDPKGVSYERFMKASGHANIPHCYLIDRAGQVAYMGHTGGLVNVLESVLEGKFDLAAATKKYADEQHRAQRKREIEARLAEAYKQGKIGDVLLAFDEMIALGPKYAHFAVNKFQLLMREMKDATGAYAWAREAAATCLEKDAYSLNTIAFLIVIRPDFVPKDYDVALELALQAKELTKGKDGPIWNTLGAVYSKRKEWKEAVDAQSKAVDLTPEGNQRKGYSRTLVTYRKTLLEQA